MDEDSIPALKCQVAEAIKRELECHYAAGAALLMRTDVVRVADLKRGRLKRFSLETLIRFANRLGLEVQLECSRRRLMGCSGAGPDA
jgi:predicted XRE-type DNA-binding protein